MAAYPPPPPPGPYAPPGAYPPPAGYPPPYGGYPAPPSGRATWSLVLGLLGLFCGGCCLGIFCSPLAWFLGASEVSDIRRGLAPPSGEGRATAGKILGIIGTILTLLGFVAGVLWVFLAGGLAVLGGVLEGMG